jgi:uncharacterized phosphatase
VTDPVRTIYLARHGETEWNRIGRWQGATDIPLSDRGREQARALAEKLRDRRITRVHASHLSRALETAQIIAAHLGLPAPIVDDRLRERGYGAFEGLTRDECAARHPEVWARYQADRRSAPPGAEPQDEVEARVLAAMHAIAAAAETSLVLSHGGTIRSFIHATTGIVPPPADNGSVFCVRFAGGAFLSADGL